MVKLQRTNTDQKSQLLVPENEYTIDEMSKLQFGGVFKIVCELDSCYITSPYTILKKFQDTILKQFLAQRTKPGLA